jgi:hypothetical protein
MLVVVFDASERARMAELPKVGSDPTSGGSNVGIRTAKLYQRREVKAAWLDGLNVTN